MIHFFLKIIFKLCFRVTTQGIRNFKEVGSKAVIIANHRSLIDALLLTLFLPGAVSVAIDIREYKKRWQKILLMGVNVLPINPSNPTELKKIIAHIKLGNKVIMFPEGRVTVTGALMKIYESPALVAKKAGVPIVPVHIEGAQFSLFSFLKDKLPRRCFPKITLNIEQAHLIEEDGKNFKKTNYRDHIHNIMTEMSLQSGNANKSLFQAVTNTAKIHGWGTKILDDSSFEPMSYRKFIASSITLSKYIKKITNNDAQVGLMIPNSKGAALSFFALQASGQTSVMLNYAAGPTNICDGCTTAKVRHVVTSRKFITLAKLEHVIDALGSKNINIHYLEDFAKNKKFYAHYFLTSLLAPALASKCLTVKKGARTASTILFTSGSIGSPKGVVLSHKNILSNCLQMTAMVDFNSQDKAFSSAPIFHSFGLTAGMLLPLLSGFQVFMYPSPIHYTLIPEMVYASNATVMFATNTFLQGYAKKAHDYDFYSVRYIFAGGEKLQDSTYRLYCDRFGIRIFQGYGVTETTPGLSLNTPIYNRPGSVGKLMPGIERKLTEIEGIKTGRNLSVKGPNVMLGYMKIDKPGLVQPIKDGWHDTGDIVHFDDDDFLFIKGRAKRFAKVGSEMVPLQLLEELAQELWPNEFHACTSISDTTKGETLVFVTEKQDADLSILKKHIESLGYPKLYAPKIIHKLEEMPVLGSGKPDYACIIKLLEKTPRL